MIQVLMRCQYLLLQTYSSSLVRENINHHRLAIEEDVYHRLTQILQTRELWDHTFTLAGRQSRSLPVNPEFTNPKGGLPPHLSIRHVLSDPFRF